MRRPDAPVPRPLGPAGTVFLVGAGPGDPELLTLRARRVLEAADVVLYDRLVDPAVLGWCRPGAMLVSVGKRAGCHSVPQAGIEAALVRWARCGKRVVRLKGGDPFVFGRGGEEAEHLARHGVAFEVVPGVTAALGAAAALGIPLTHRVASSSVTLVTGHEDPHRRRHRVRLAAHARAGGTLCIYMGLGRLGRLLDELRRGGSGARTPVAVVEAATSPRQRTVTGTLGSIAGRVARAGLGSPALVIVGRVVARRHRTAAPAPRAATHGPEPARGTATG